MRRTTPLTAAAALGLALLAPTASPGAAGETCRGEAAPIVGTSRTLAGTEGRDVIVSGAATDVKALGGDDLICVVPDRSNTNVLSVDSGAGNDVVDTTSAALMGYYVDSDLGPGADTLEGGPSGDWVDTGDAAGGPEEVDVVRGSTGDDTVRTTGGSDVVELGPGTNRIWLDGPGITPEGRLAGGDGYDTLATTVASSAVFDMAAGTYVGTGGSARFSSFESLDLGSRGARVTWTGTEGADYMNVETFGPEPTVLVADALGGDDRLSIDQTLLGPGSRIDAGAGDDRLVAARTRGRLALDLERDRLDVARDTFPATGLEDAFLMARRVDLVGDAQDNTLISLACTTTILAGHGDDELIWDGDYIFEEYSFSCTKTADMHGGPGDDSFYGSPGDDRLQGYGDRDTIRGDAGDDVIRGGTGADRISGDGGRDRADGGKGRDRCSAERKRSC